MSEKEVLILRRLLDWLDDIRNELNAQSEEACHLVVSALLLSDFEKVRQALAEYIVLLNEAYTRGYALHCILKGMMEERRRE